MDFTNEHLCDYWQDHISDEKQAAKGLDRMVERVPDYDGEPYYCLYCANYHFGKRKDRVKNKRKRT